MGLARVLTLVALVSASVYIITLRHDFVWDDLALIAENSYVRSPRFVAEYFRQDFGRLSHGYIRSGYYRPLLALSFLADYQAWGKNPAGFHLTNLLLHLAASVLVTLVARRLSGQDGVGALAGLFFATHPAHVEPVAFVAARVDMLLAIFGVASVLAALGARRACGPRRWAWRGLAWTAVAGSLLSKETGVLVPGLMCLCLMWDVRREGASWRTAMLAGLRGSAGGFIVLLLYLVGRSLFIPDPVSWGYWAQGPKLWHRWMTGVYLAGRTIELTTLGFPWQPLYQMVFLPRPDVRVALGGLLLAGVGWGIWWGLPRGALAALGGLWLLATIFPVLNIIPMPSTSPQEVYFAERFVYLPSVGVALAAGHLGMALLESAEGRRRRMALTAITAALVVLGVIAAQRSDVWRDNLRLYTEMLEHSPGAPVALTNLALIALEQGQPEDAIRLAGPVLDNAPRHVSALNIMGRAHIALGRTEEGLAVLLKSVEYYPNHPVLLTTLAISLIEADRRREAIPYLERALAVAPQFPPAWANLGRVLALEGDLEEGIRLLRKAQALLPDSPAPRIQIGRLLLEQGHEADALGEFQAALRLDPENTVATWAMASTLDRLGRRGEAGSFWEKLRTLPGAERYPGMRTE